MRLVSITGKRQCVAAEIHPGSERKPDQMLADRSKMTAAYVGWSLGALGFYYAWFQRVIPSVMVDRLMADFAVGGAVLGTLSSLYFYAYAVMQLPVGAMVDRWGPALPYAGALILAALGSSLFAVAESIEMAYAGRILIGVGSAFGWVAALKIIAERFPPDRFAMMSGAGMFIGLCGGFSGQVIAGSLVDAFGWRITMWGAAIAGLLLSVAVYAFIGRRPAESAVDAPTMREILSGFAVALRNHKIWLVAGGGAIAAAPIFIFGSLWGVPYLMQVHGLERSVAASLTATILAGWGVGAFLSGWMSDRIGARRKPVVFGLVVALISLTTVIYGPKLPVLALGGLLLVAGLGSGVVVLSYAMAGDLSIAATRGSAYAFANMLMILSGAIFQPVAGWLLDLNWYGSTSNGARVYDAAAYETTFLMVPVTYVTGLVMILLSRYDEPSKSRNLSTTL